MPEAFVSGTAISREVSRAVKAGRLRKLASRLYTRNLTDPPAAVVRRNLWTLVAGYFPDALGRRPHGAGECARRGRLGLPDYPARKKCAPSRHHASLQARRGSDLLGPVFQTLHGALRGHPPITRPAPDRRAEPLATLAFFDAYFSNFIEGTEFAVEEAAGIVFRGVIPAERPRDAHDVLGTWRIVSDAPEMRRIPADAATFLRLLKERHRAIMERRFEVRSPRSIPSWTATGAPRGS